MKSPKRSTFVAFALIFLATFVAIVVATTTISKGFYNQRFRPEARSIAQGVLSFRRWVAGTGTIWTDKLHPDLRSFLEKRDYEGDHGTVSFYSKNPALATRELSEVHASLSGGTTFGVSSDRWRAPENRPDGFETHAINVFRSDPNDGYEERFEDQAYRYAQPIKLVESCLKCHGDPDDAPPAVVEKYGRVRGFGEKVGDVRGIISVRIPLPGLYSSVQKARLYVVGPAALLLTMILLNLVWIKRVVEKPVALMARTNRRTKKKERQLTQLIEGKSRQVYKEQQLLQRNYKRSKAKEVALTRLIETKARDIYNEREKSEKLLLNILPGEIAEELKRDGHSRPVSYESASVLFTDFVGFTSLADQLPPVELVAELDRYFSHFDSVTKRHNLEKIKTIGDSYMTCGGVPHTNATHAVDSVLAAMDMRAHVNLLNARKSAQGIPHWGIRIGVNTGPLIAAVIGEMKFSYDIFGDTVNTASRMELSGEAGRINISRATYESVKGLFDCERRGKVAAKNKGEIEMFFVTGLKEELSVDGDRATPNETFMERYASLGV